MNKIVYKVIAQEYREVKKRKNNVNFKKIMDDFVKNRQYAFYFFFNIFRNASFYQIKYGEKIRIQTLNQIEYYFKKRNKNNLFNEKLEILKNLAIDYPETFCLNKNEKIFELLNEMLDNERNK